MIKFRRAKINIFSEKRKEKMLFMFFFKKVLAVYKNNCYLC